MCLRDAVGAVVPIACLRAVAKGFGRLRPAGREPVSKVNPAGGGIFYPLNADAGGRYRNQHRCIGYEPKNSKGIPIFKCCGQIL